MAYTVKKISTLSGVTVRTLHFYEEEGLLKPSYYGENGYRYYEEKELLRLQQILFFKELGFSLKQIQKVLGTGDFDQLAALHSHRKELCLEKKKIEILLKTIDGTINHLQGKKKMEDQEFFQGFGQITAGKGDESYFLAETLVLQNLKNPSQKANKENIAKSGNEIYRQIAECLKAGEDPGSSAVQLLVKKHYDLAEEFHVLTKPTYIALAQMYLEHPGFREQLDPFDLRLAEFLSKAMNLFAIRNLN